MKLMVIGHGRHGKDTVCDMLKEEFGLTFASSSMVAAEKVLYPKLKDKYGYETFEECYEDRHNHRQEWFEEIQKINAEDKTTLGRIIYAENDVYCGIRDVEEFEALRDAGVFQYSIWVDRSEHLDPEGEESCTVQMKDAQYVLDNNGDLDDLRKNLRALMRELQADSMGVDLEKLAKAKKGKKNFGLRKMFGFLTKEEHAREMKREAKEAKVEAGMVKIYALLWRAGI